MRLALLAISAVLAGCSHASHAGSQAVVLDELLAFSAQCRPQPAFAQLLDSLLSANPKGDVRTGKPEVPAAFRSAFGKVRVARPAVEGQDLWQVQVDVTGRWRGLRITRLVRELVPQSGVQGFQLHFAESPAKVAEQLRLLGLPVTIGGVVDVADEGMSVWATLLRDGSGSLFDCGT